MWYKPILVALFVLAMAWPSHANTTWGTLDPNYAIVPGKSIGQLNLGMPLKDANTIAQKVYGKAQDGANVGLDGFVCYGDNEEICLAVDDNNKVSRLIAERDTIYYVAVPNTDPDNFPHLMSANLKDMTDALGTPTDQTSMDTYLGVRWVPLGTIAIFQVDPTHNVDLLWSIGIYN